MTKPRVKETDQGIQGELLVETYDQFQRGMRDKGWIETKAILQAGIDHGHALELGQGPGYVGLEWLKLTRDTHLTGLDISPDMVALAGRNAQAYGLTERANYVRRTGDRFPFEDQQFDAAFTTGSLHEWEDPRGTFAELWRVLKPGGILFISDLRRDMSPFIKWFLWLGASPREIRPGLVTSINAAYCVAELEELTRGTPLQGCKITGDTFGLTLVAAKPGTPA
jgi:ubiquinone/menaquinone biosynthesis C-methylase UbiE